MSPTSHIKTLIVEDHEVMLHGLTTYLKEFIPLVEVVATTASASEALQLVTTHALDLIIMDIHLGPHQNGFTLIKDLSRQFPNLAILIYSADTNIELVRRAQQAGSRGYINKGAGKEIFKQAIDVLSKGMTYFPKLTQEVEELTHSEQKVMKLLAQDKKDADVATDLEIKPATVRTHCCNIMSKLDLSYTHKSPSLEEALRLLVERCSHETVRVNLIASGETKGISSAAEETLLFISREVLANAIDHSSATVITVELKGRAHDVVLQVHDDGRDFNVDAIESDLSHGLRLHNLKEQIETQGGTWCLTSSPTGTTITVTIPKSS